ncbi:cobalamin B12-binding domain-containing protein [Saccharothrix xinjiangensis]|uniref:B12-binding domain-containing protein n=1 Tax=Saccharothrix xinjiangensis TaxID=204798 RepID=A0ABV9Y988_9PSEU
MTDTVRMTDVLAAGRAELMTALAEADEHAALDQVLGLLDAGVPAEGVLLEVVAAAQAEIGRLWQADRWGVAQEHAATAVVEHVIAALGARVTTATTRGHVVVACLEGERHAVPPRIVAEVLRGRGWQVTFLGAGVPIAHLVPYLREKVPDAVALSCTLARDLPRADQAVAACRDTGTPVLVGGRGFGEDGRWARALGVDTWAPDAAAAADLLDRPGWRRAARPAPPRPVAPAYTALLTRRAELVDAAVAALDERFPPARDDERQPDEVREEVGELVDFLGASVYVDDPELFGGFVSWTAAAPAARRLPPAGTRVVIEVLARALRADPPGVLRHLDCGRQVLATR